MVGIYYEFVCIVSFISIETKHNVVVVVVLILFYKWRNQSLEGVNNLPKVMQSGVGQQFETMPKSLSNLSTIFCRIFPADPVPWKNELAKLVDKQHPLLSSPATTPHISILVIR